MTAILHIDSPRCRESALHGLNHWTTGHRGEVSTIIDAYLARNPTLDPALVRTALAAKEGTIQ